MERSLASWLLLLDLRIRTSSFLLLLDPALLKPERRSRGGAQSTLYRDVRAGMYARKRSLELTGMALLGVDTWLLDWRFCSSHGNTLVLACMWLETQR